MIFRPNLRQLLNGSEVEPVSQTAFFVLINFSTNQKTLTLYELGFWIYAPGGTRTPDLQIRSLKLYPAELQAQVQGAASAALNGFNNTTFIERNQAGF